jgi:hypothetical protein
MTGAKMPIRVDDFGAAVRRKSMDPGIIGTSTIRNWELTRDVGA